MKPLISLSHLEAQIDVTGYRTAKTRKQSQLYSPGPSRAEGFVYI